MNDLLSRLERHSAATILLVAIAAGPSAAQSRYWQPLIIKGAQMQAPIVGAPIDHLEVLVMQGGRSAPIPFQVDEVRPDGQYALPKGPEPLSDDSPGILDNDDQLVMMISDLGERATDPAALPVGTLEIEMTDPIDSSHRYAYVAYVESPRLSPRDYVDFDPKANKIESEHYRLGFTHELPTDFALQSHKGEGRPNLIDRLKFRISARILLGLATFRLNESDVRNQMVAYTDGPIRVIRRLRHSVTIALGIRSPKVTSEDFFYRDYIDNPFDVSLPWVPRLIFGDIVARTYLDFLDLKGYELAWSGMKGPPLKLGTSLPPEAQDPAVDWLSFRGADEVMVQTLVFGPDLQPVKRHLFYDPGVMVADPPEQFPGNHPGVGYVMTDWEQISSGHHHFDSILMKAPGKNFNPDQLLNELRQPPSIAVRAIEKH